MMKVTFSQFCFIMIFHSHLLNCFSFSITRTNHTFGELCEKSRYQITTIEPFTVVSWPLCANSNLHLILFYAQFSHQLFLLSSAPAALVRKDLIELSKKNNSHIGSWHTEYNTLLMQFFLYRTRIEIGQMKCFIVLCWTKVWCLC